MYQFVLGQLKTKTNTEISFSFCLTLFYSIPLLALTHRQTDGRTEERINPVGAGTLASRGLEEPFFQLFCCVVLVFGSCGNKVFDLLSVCLVRGSGDYDRKKKIQSSVWRVVLLCQFLVLAGNRHFFCSGGKF